MNNDLKELKALAGQLLEQIGMLEENAETQGSPQPADWPEEGGEAEDPPQEETQEPAGGPDAGPDFPGKEAELISVVGTRPGMGVTHHCILFASLLQRAGISVAVADFSRSEEVEGGVVPYYRADIRTMEEIAFRYDMILLDLGTFSDCDRSLFRRCQRRIVLAGNKSWEKQGLTALFEAIPDQELERYIYLFNHVPVPERAEVLRGMAPIRNIFFADYTPDPYDSPGGDAAEQIFPELIDQTKKRRRKGHVKKEKAG